MNQGLCWWLSRKEFTCNAGAEGGEGSISDLGRSPGGEGMATHYSILVWEGLQSMRMQRVGHN